MSSGLFAAIDDLARPWADAMLRACWQGGLLIAVAWVFCRLFPRLPASVRCWLWWLAALKLLIGLITCAFSIPLPLPPDRGSVFPPEVQAPSRTVRIPNGRHAAQQSPLRGKPSTSVVYSSPSTGVVIELVPPPQSHLPAFPLRTTLLILWSVGVLARLTLSVLQVRVAGRCVRGSRPVESAEVMNAFDRLAASMGLHRRIALRLSDRIISPMLVGLVRPIVLLPDGRFQRLSASERGMALAHELAHVRRGDLWLNWPISLAQTLFFFHPLAWLAAREYALCREAACDSAAVITTGQCTADYGQLLLSLLAIDRSALIPGGLGAAIGYHQLQRRLTMLQTLAPASRRMRRFALGAIMMASIATLVPWNVVAAPLQDENPLEGNTKLEQKVEISAEGIPVGDLLKLLSDKTGTNLSADPYVADDKVMIFGPTRPLKAWMSDLAAHFNDKWRHYVNVEGKEKYVLQREPRAREYEDGLANVLGNRMLAQLDAMVNALNESPQELAKRPEHDPVREALSDTDNRITVQLYAQLSPDARLALFQQGSIGLPFSELPKNLQDDVTDTYTRWINRFVKEEKQRSQTPLDPELANQRIAELKTRQISFSVTQAFGRTAIHATPAGTVAVFKDNWQWLVPPHGNPYTNKPIRQDETLPAEEDLAAASKETGLPDRLRKLAETSHFPIVADYYRTKPVTRPFGDQGATPTDGTKSVQAMDRFCFEDGLTWWIHGGTLLIRKRDWYNQRQYEPPDSWLLALNRRLQSQPGPAEFTFNDVFSPTSLTPRQIIGLTGLKFRDAPKNSRSIGEMDDSSAAGLHELLVLARSLWPAPDRPLPGNTGVPSNIEEHGPDLVTIDPARLTADQRTLLGSFLAKQPGAIDPADSSLFYLHIVPSLEHVDGLDKSEWTNWKTVSIEINSVQGNAKRRAEPGPIAHAYNGYSALLFLPTQLPDDRRGKTRVAVVGTNSTAK